MSESGRSAKDDPNDVTCIYCGRTGPRGWVQVSGNGDGTRDQYGCANREACERRQQQNPLPSQSGRDSD